MNVQPAEFTQSVYNLESKYITTNSRQLDGTNTTGRVDEELLVGASSFGTYDNTSNNPNVTLEEGLSGVANGQFYKASTITTRPELVKFDWRGDPRISQDARALDLWCMIQNSELFKESQKRYEGTFRLPDGGVKPVGLLDLFQINFNTLSEDNYSCILKLTHKTKSNRYSIYGFDLNPVPNVLVVDYTDVRFNKTKT
jgi:hypothetical protein